MDLIEQCSRCQYNTRNPHLFCALHPTGVDANTCPDFAIDPNAEPEKLWEPEGVASSRRLCN